jgi:hypothetical protein
MVARPVPAPAPPPPEDDSHRPSKVQRTEEAQGGGGGGGGGYDDSGLVGHVFDDPMPAVPLPAAHQRGFQVGLYKLNSVDP